MGCESSVNDFNVIVYPIDINKYDSLEHAVSDLPHIPLKEMLQGRDISAVKLGQDGEKVVVNCIKQVINALHLPFRLKHVSQEDYCADIQLECLINDLIILVEVKNKQTITDTQFDNKDHPKGDINKFDRDLYLAATKHPTGIIEGLFVSLVSDVNHVFLHKNVVKICNEQLTAQTIARYLIDMIKKYPKTEDTWIG